MSAIFLTPETWAMLAKRHLTDAEVTEIAAAALRDTARVTAAINAITEPFHSEREAALALLRAVRRQVGSA